MNGSTSGREGAAPRNRLLRSLCSAVLLDERGDVELERETRGAPLEWGGIYGQLVRLTGPWRIALSTGDSPTSLPASRTAVRVTGDRYESWHRLDRLSVHQEIVPHLHEAGAGRSFRFSLGPGAPLRVTLTSSVEPFLLPVLVEGIRPVSFQLETRPDELRVRQRGFAFALRTSVAPSHLFRNRSSWLGGRFHGPVAEFGSAHEVLVSPGVDTEVRFSIAGGLERTLDRSRETVGGTLPDPATEAAESAGLEAAWLGNTPVLRFPGAPELERAYELSRAALRRLYASPGEGLVGLVAGYPWYSSLWCRDIAWMLPAVLWLGDFEWAHASIASVLRFQARAKLALLGGEPGELPMQIAPGPLFLYGTSDTSLHYPELALRFLRHSGQWSLVEQWLPAVDEVVAWGSNRTDPSTGLLRNGGEAAAMAAATEALARVRYGIDAPDTTIWDSTDRRDHAIDVQVLWCSALRASGELRRGPGEPTTASQLAIADRTAASIRTLYPWPEETYLYDSLRGGKPVARVRPNALRAVSAGIMERDTARAIVLRASREDLSTPWGVRTLSAQDKGYSPVAYHDGQVWTIATAWAADAALAVGEVGLGVDFLKRIAERFVAEEGDANECYRGDKAEPFNSCFLLGFSVGPFLTVLFERLWGLSVDAREPSLGVLPRFPPGWPSASIGGLRIGAGHATIEWTPDEIRVSWTGPGTLEVHGPLSASRVEPGRRETLPCH